MWGPQFWGVEFGSPPVLRGSGWGPLALRGSGWGPPVSEVSLPPQYVLKPTFTAQHIAHLDKQAKLSRAYDGTTYLPGIVGLNNIKANDYANAVLQVTPELKASFWGETPPKPHCGLDREESHLVSCRLYTVRVFRLHSGVKPSQNPALGVSRMNLISFPTAHAPEGCCLHFGLNPL